MSAKAIYESTAKELLYKHVKAAKVAHTPSIIIDSETKWSDVEQKNSWLSSQVSEFVSFYHASLIRRCKTLPK